MREANPSQRGVRGERDQGRLPLDSPWSSDDRELVLDDDIGRERRVVLREIDGDRCVETGTGKVSRQSLA